MFYDCVVLKKFWEKINNLLQALFTDRFVLTKFLGLFNTPIPSCIRKIKYHILWSVLTAARKTITKNGKSELTPSFAEFKNIVTEVCCLEMLTIKARTTRTSYSYAMWSSMGNILNKDLCVL